MNQICLPATLAILFLGAQTAGLWAQAYPASRHGGNYMHNFYLPPAPASTPWAPAWSPDGRWIAVSMGGTIWRVDPATGEASELTDPPGYHSSPHWSPDGEWILYTVDDGGGTIDIAILEVATGRSRQLTDDSHLYLEPRFSPDGGRVAYVSTRPDGYFNIYLREISEGQWRGEPVAVTHDNDFGRERLYFGPWDMHINPAWLPDGEHLLIVSNRDTPLGSGSIWRVPATAGGFENREIVHREQTLYRTSPSVALDGKRFVYSSTAGAADQFNNLYVLPTSGGEPYKLTFFDHDAFSPRFSPDGEWIAYIDNEQGLPQLALLETYGGSRRTVAITDRRWRRETGTLTVEVRDDAGRPTAARIHLEAADGRFYAPTDSYARVSSAGDPAFHTRGQFRIQLPAGNTSLTAAKGFEFLPKRQDVMVEPGRVSRVVITLDRLADMGARGWYSGSTHVHMNYAGNLHNTLENLQMMSAAEDQDVINEQVANKDNRVLDHQYFVPGGGPHPLSRPDQLLVVGQEYRPPFYGHVFMLGLRDHLISPFVTGYEGTAIESLYPSNTDMLRKARQQGATTGYVHPFGADGDPIDRELGRAKSFLVDAALGTVDALEWSGSGRGGFYPWYAALSNGLRVTAVGGEDSISNLHRSKLVGSVRTYVYTGERGLDMAAWFEALRNGHAFMTTGPLVELTVDGLRPGETLRLTGPGEVTVQASARSIVPLGSAFLVANGEKVVDIDLEPDQTELKFTARLPFDRSGWVHLRVEGRPEDRFPLDCDWPQALTNPVWIEIDDKPVRSLKAAQYGIRWMEQLKVLAAAWPGWRSEREKAHVFRQFDEALEVYRARAAEARKLGAP